MTLFEKVKETAKERGYSLQETAKRAGLGINSLYQWKNKQPSAASLQSVADVLGVSVDYLLGNTDEMHPKTSDNNSTDDLKEYFQEHKIMRYDGKPIPDSDLEVIKRILESH